MRVRLVAALCYNVFRFILRAITSFGKIRVVPISFTSPGCELLASKGKIKVGYKSRFEKHVRVKVSGGDIVAGRSVYMNRGVNVIAREKITLGNRVTIGPNTCIYDHDHDHDKRTGKDYITAPVVIEDNVWIGAGCIILKGVTIGKNSVIAAGCVVTNDVPSDSIMYQKRETVLKTKGE